MKMNKKNILLPVALAVFCLAGCRSGETDVPQIQLRDFTAGDDALAQKAATDYMDGFVRALETGEFSHWQPVLTANGATEITEEKFVRMKAELNNAFGRFEGAEYLGFLITGNLRSYLWKFRFSREENSKTVIREVVFYTKVFCADGENPAVSGFGVKIF